jgi:8-oxo-dGTP diphosphatase
MVVRTLNRRAEGAVDMSGQTARTIIKIGAVILDDDGRILVVRKSQPEREIFIIPGGRLEEGETDDQACRRELDEELGLQVTHSEYFGTFTEPAEFDPVDVEIRVYAVKTAGKPTAQSEIAEYRWVDRGYRSRGIQLGSVLDRHVVPKLVAQGRM